jgi:DNA repair exonuclease SbcCD ATPase subunit
MLSYSIPFLNKQIERYMHKFKIRGKIWFNNYLQVMTDKWPYDLYSGGERRRIDMATMFSFRNLHEVLFGRPSNIMVLDEVDGRLDNDGIERFVSEIGDLSDEDNGPSTILIISHKESMKDAFSSKIQIEKDGDFSFIDEVRS